MADGVQIKSNINEVLKEIAVFREDVSVRTVRTAARRSSVEAAKQLKAATPVRTGKLAANERVTAKYAKARGVVTARVVVNTVGKADNPRNAFYWRWVERGHKTRGSTVVPPQPFIQSTWARLQSVISGMFFTDLQKAVDRAGKRYL